MIVATAISLLLSVIAILLSVRWIYYTRRQTEIMEEQREQKRHEDEVTAEWAAKFDEAVSAILKGVGECRRAAVMGPRHHCHARRA